MRDEKRYDAHLLARYLRDEGRKQRWLADQIGAHESLVSEWVNGRRTISKKRAKQVAKALGVPFYLLFDVTEETDKVTGERAA